MKSSDLLMLVAVVAVLLASVNLIITVNKIGDFKTLTGRYADTGVANLTIQSNVIVNFTTDFIDWGTGNVPTAETECELRTTGIMNCTGFSTLSNGLILENIGNENVNLNLSSSKNAASFIGGTNPVFQWNVTNSEEGSCPSGINISTFTDVSTSLVRACDNFTFIDSSDVLEIDLRIVIPNDAPIEGKTVTITADAQTMV